MKINRKNNSSHKLLYSLLCIILVFGVGAAIYWYILNNSSGIKTPATESQKEAGVQTKQVFLNEGDSSQNRSPKTTENAAPNDARVIITEATQIEDKSVRVGSIIQSANANGTCSLTLTKGNQVIQQSSTALPQSNYTACPDFTVTYSQLTPGTWKATVTYQDAEKKGEASKDIEVN